MHTARSKKGDYSISHTVGVIRHAITCWTIVGDPIMRNSAFPYPLQVPPRYSPVTPPDKLVDDGVLSAFNALNC
jgi:hypothetical protein